MTYSWEVTIDDVSQICQRHQKKFTLEQISDIHDIIDCDSVENAGLAYTDFDKQCEAAFSEIEDQMIEGNYINSPKQFLPD